MIYESCRVIACPLSGVNLLALIGQGFFCFEGCCVAFESPTQAEIFAAEKMLQFEPQRKRIQRISVNLTNPKTHATQVLTFGEGWIVVRPLIVTVPWV